jgi:hypothetical protein
MSKSSKINGMQRVKVLVLCFIRDTTIEMQPILASAGMDADSGASGEIVEVIHLMLYNHPKPRVVFVFLSCRLLIFLVL